MNTPKRHRRLKNGSTGRYEALFTRCRQRAAATVSAPKAHRDTAGART